MNWHVKRLLQYLADGEWHVFEKLPKGIGVGTVEFCIERGFVRTKMVDRKRKGNIESYQTALRISHGGENILQGSPVS